MPLAQCARHHIDNDKEQSEANCVPTDMHPNSLAGLFTHFWFFFYVAIPQAIFDLYVKVCCLLVGHSLN